MKVHETPIENVTRGIYYVMIYRYAKKAGETEERKMDSYKNAIERSHIRTAPGTGADADCAHGATHDVT